MKRSANDRGSRGNAPAGIQSLTRSFSMYITYVYCAIIEPRLWNNVVPGTFFCAGRKSFIFLVVPGGNRECWAAPPGAAHRSYNPGHTTRPPRLNFLCTCLNHYLQTQYPSSLFICCPLWSVLKYIIKCIDLYLPIWEARWCAAIYERFSHQILSGWNQTLIPSVPKAQNHVSTQRCWKGTSRGKFGHGGGLEEWISCGQWPSLSYMLHFPWAVLAYF